MKTRLRVVIVPQLGSSHIKNPEDRNDSVRSVLGTERERALQMGAQGMHVTRPAAIFSHPGCVDRRGEERNWGIWQYIVLA